MELTIDHTQVTKPPKNPKSIRFEGFQVGEYTYIPGGLCTPTPQEQKLFHAKPLQTLSYASLHGALHQYPLS